MPITIPHMRGKKNHVRAANQAWINEIKAALGCVYCNERNPARLHFHHPDPGKKYCNVSNLAGRQRDKILAEIAKCDVVCASCHGRIHWKSRLELWAKDSADAD